MEEEDRGGQGSTTGCGAIVEEEDMETLAYVADRLKKLRGFGQPYLVNVKIVLISALFLRKYL